MKIYFLFGLLGFLVSACYEKPKDNSKEKNHVVFEPAFKGLDAFLNYQEKIEQRKDLKTLQSLLFTHKSGYILQSKVYLSARGEIFKATLERSDTNGIKVTSTFYFLKEVLTMVQVDKENLRLSNLELHQTRVFYDASQRPIAAYYRKVNKPKNNSVFHQNSSIPSNTPPYKKTSIRFLTCKIKRVLLHSIVKGLTKLLIRSLYSLETPISLQT